MGALRRLGFASRGRSSMAEPQVSNLPTRVQLPSPAPVEPRPTRGALTVPTPDGSTVTIPLGVRQIGPTAWLAYPLDGAPVVLSPGMGIVIDCIPPGHSVELDVDEPVSPVLVRGNMDTTLSTKRKPWQPTWVRRT